MDSPWSKKEEQILKELNTSKEGLNTSELPKRYEKYGYNKIEKKKNFKALKILWDQINSPLIYILIFAMIVSFVLESAIDAYVILAIIILNAGIGFYQQFRAEDAINNLKKFMIPKAKVKRDGKIIVIDSSELVPGDIVMVETGEKISADLRILECENLSVSEAVLTGESEPVSKKLGVLKENTPTAERKNMLFAGTKIETGSAIAIVVATGSYTEFGSIADQLQEINTQKTPMQKRIEKFSKQIGMVIIGLVVLVFILGVLSKNDLGEMLMIAITLAVGAIPEGLPAVMAIAFSISSGLMAKKNVIIRRLPAVESLGSVTVICTDKTGTITEEKMKIQKIFLNNDSLEKEHNELKKNGKKIDHHKNKHLIQLIKTSVLASNARFEEKRHGYDFIGDPTETALISNGLDLGYSRKILTEESPRLQTFEFDSDRKLMSILRRGERGNMLHTKGAPEKILEICTHELNGESIEKISDQRKKALLKEVETMEEQALRILGFAYKNFSKNETVKESGLIFLGFMGMMDPPRKEVAEAVKLCKSAGIQVKMITGDSLVTAKAVANKVGIKGDAIDSKGLENMSDAELLNNIDNLAIFARATPQQKLRIEQALQKKGHTVAMTGDGVNDVLALKSADVGISMGVKGTDVARDVSDIILVDDNFASIVNGVKYGRVTYDNIKKFTKYMLGVNFDTIVLVTITALLRLPLPILPLQILWKNIVTDSFPAISLIFEKDEGVMETPPRREKSPLEGSYRFLIITGLLNLTVCSFVYFYMLSQAIDIDTIRTTVMTTDILFELFFIYTCRSKKPIRKIGIFSNKFLNISVLVALILQVILLYTSAGLLFDLVPLPLYIWYYILPLSLSGVIIYEIIKEFRYRKKSK